MDPIQIALTSVLLPALLAASLLVAVALAGRRGRPLSALAAPRWAGVALAAAFGLGFSLTLAWPALPPVDVTQVAPWAALLAAPLGFLPARWRALGTGLLGAGLGLFLAGPALEGGALLGSAVAVSAAALAIERGLALAPQGRLTAVAALVLVSGVAAVVMLSDVASLAVTTGSLAAGIGALFSASLVAPGLATINRAGPVIALVAVAHLFSASLYANGSPAPIALLALAPLAAGLLARRAAVLTPIVTAVIASAAVGLAATRYLAEAPPPAPDEASEDEDYGY